MSKYEVLTIEDEEKLAEKHGIEVFGSEENAKSTVELIKETLNSYFNKPKDLPLNEWVKLELAKHPNEFPNKEVIEKSSKEIIESVEVIEADYEEIKKDVKDGKSVESWIAKKIETGATSANIVNVGTYAKGIENALKEANEQSIRIYTNRNGEMNLNPNLHGFVAENHHVNSFNIEATTKNSPYRAEILESTNKNSVDIQIKDIRTGEVVKRYQAKYGQNAKSTDKLFLDEDSNYKYKGQGKLVPKGQESEIKNAKDCIEIDGVKSKSLSYEEAKKIQAEIQQEKNIREHNWDKVDKTIIAKSIAMETSKMVMFHSLIQGGRVLARRVWNKIRGEKNQKVKTDLKEWFDSSVDGAKSIGIKTAIVTGVTIAVRKGFMKIAKSTPIATITNIVHVGIENAKIMYKMAMGHITLKEGLKEMSVVNASTLGGIAGAIKGGAIGTSLGAIFSPVGAMICGFIGSAVGGIAGSGVGELIVKGTEKVVNYAVDTYKSVAKAVCDVGSKVGNSISAGFNKVKSFFS